MTRLTLGMGAALALALAVAGSGCGSRAHGSLEWERAPIVLAPRELPRDRIVVGRIRNRSGSLLHLSAARVLIRDRDGRVLKGSSGFTTTFAHGLFGAFEQPSTIPRRELVRLGRIVDLAPGASAPFFAAWRLRPASRQPVSIDYGSGALTVTQPARPTGP